MGSSGKMAFLLTLVAILALVSNSSSEPRPQLLPIAAGIVTPLGAAAITPAGAALGLLGGGLALGAATLGAAALSRNSRQRFGRRRRFGFGKRSTEDDNHWEALDSIQEKITELFHRASQLDDEQCVQRLICEVNSDSVMYDSQMDSIILNSFGGNGSGSSLFPEFDTAAQIGS